MKSINRNSRSFVSAGSTTLLFLLIAIEVIAAPSLTLTATDVRVTGVARGGQIVLTGVARSAGRSGSILVSTVSEILLDDDRDGAITFTPKFGVPDRSVWVAVDYDSGTTATAAPADFNLVQRTAKPNSMKRDANGEGVSLELERPRMFFTLVRPRKGAWNEFLVESGKRDGDKKADGKLTILPDTAVDLAGQKNPPKKFLDGDVVIGIDPGRLDVLLFTVAK